MDFTHFDPGGKAWMVDVSGKEDTRREAVAEGTIRMSRECFDRREKITENREMARIGG